VLPPSVLLYTPSTALGATLAGGTTDTKSVLPVESVGSTMILEIACLSKARPGPSLSSAQLLGSPPLSERRMPVPYPESPEKLASPVPA
jgi:hypothetical protein